MKITNRFACLLTVIFISFLTASALANPGDIDTTFGTSGKTITSIGSSTNDYVQAAVLLPGGGILVAVTEQNISSPDFERTFFVRYDNDGILDTAFGGGDGIVSSDKGRAYSMIVLPDGKILTSGRYKNGSNYESFVARYNLSDSDITIDDSFGTSGMTTIDFESSEDVEGFRAVAVKKDSKIVAVGSLKTSSIVIDPNNYKFVVVQFSGDGNPDGSFGDDGKFIYDMVPGPTGNGKREALTSVVIQTSGRIVAGGYAQIDSTYKCVVLGLTEGGVLDPDFGYNAGYSNSITGKIYDMALLPDDSIAAAGGSNWPIVIKYMANGKRDMGVGSSGVIYSSNIGLTPSVAIQPDGKMLITDRATVGFNVERININGTDDSTFGTGGQAVINFGNYNFHEPRKLLLQADGRIIVIGNYDQGGSVKDVVLVGFKGDQANISINNFVTAPSPAEIDSDLVYSMNIINSGPQSASGVKFLFSLSDNVTHEVSIFRVGEEDHSCEYSADKHAISCEIGELDMLVPVEITIEVRPASVGFVDVTGGVSTETYDPNTSDNGVSSRVLVGEFFTGASAGLSLSLESIEPSGPVAPDQNVTFNISVVNSGPDASNMTYLTTVLPDKLSYVSSSVNIPSRGVVGAACDYDEASSLISCDLGTLALGSSSTISLNLKAGALGTASGNLNLMSLTTPDPDGANNVRPYSVEIAEARVIATNADLSARVGNPFDITDVEGGKNINIIAGIINDGPGNVADATLDLGVSVLGGSGGRAPVRLSAVPAFGATLTCVPAAGSGLGYVCSGTILGNSNAGVRLSYFIPRDVSVEIGASVSAPGNTDPNPGNNITTRQIRLYDVEVPGGDRHDNILLSFAGLPQDSVVQGSDVNFGVGISNNNEGRSATGVNVRVMIPVDLGPVSVRIKDGELCERTLSSSGDINMTLWLCTLGGMPAGSNNLIEVGIKPEMMGIRQVRAFAFTESGTRDAANVNLIGNVSVVASQTVSPPTTTPPTTGGAGIEDSSTAQKGGGCSLVK